MGESIENLTTRQKKAMDSIREDLRNRRSGDYTRLIRLLRQLKCNVDEGRSGHSKVYDFNGNEMLRRNGRPITIPHNHSCEMNRIFYLEVLNEVLSYFEQNYSD